MALTTIQEKLKQLESEQARLEERRAQLEAEMQRQAELDKKLDKLVETSGFANARDLVRALIEKYNLRIVNTRGSSAPAETGGRRKRTRITPELRDAIKKEVNENGTSMNAASKQFGISYAVVVKMIKGAYDNL